MRSEPGVVILEPVFFSRKIQFLGYFPVGLYDTMTASIIKKLKKIQLERSRGGRASQALKRIFLNPILLVISGFSFPKEL